MADRLTEVAVMANPVSERRTSASKPDWTSTTEPSRARLADVLGALAAATDLAAGAPMGTSIRTCLVATRLGALLGQSTTELSATYYTALLRHLGCTAFAHEAAWLAAGDDHDLLRTFEGIDSGRPSRVAARTFARLGAGAKLGSRMRAVARTLRTASAGARLTTAHCEQATALARDLGMDDSVVSALGQIYERFEGRGGPMGIRGDSITPFARLLHLASTLEIHHRQGGRQRAQQAVEDGRNRTLDPSMCDAALAELSLVWDTLELSSPWEPFLDAEPGEPKRVDGGMDAIALVFARYADLKTPVFLGHSPAVADLAAKAAALDGLEPRAIAVLRRAALLHDLGIVAVPNGIWEKPALLDAAERDQARMHSYYTARVLGRIPSLADEARIAGVHHERCDGSGYPMGVPLGVERAARILATADTYLGIVSARPHRPAVSADAAIALLRGEVLEGRLCARAMDSVLAAAGHGQRPTSPAPAGLTEREIDVLVHLARGLTTKETAVALDIASRTVQHHIEHIYAKIGVSTRTAAALFAVRNGLVRS